MNHLCNVDCRGGGGFLKSYRRQMNVILFFIFELRDKEEEWLSKKYIKKKKKINKKKINKNKKKIYRTER